DEWNKLRDLIGGMRLPELAKCAFGDGCANLLSGDVNNPYQLPDKDRYKLLLAEKAVQNDWSKYSKLARAILIRKALMTDVDSSARAQNDEHKNARNHFGLLYYNTFLSEDELASIAAARFVVSLADNPDKLITKLMFGKYGGLEPAELSDVKKQLTKA